MIKNYYLGKNLVVILEVIMYFSHIFIGFLILFGYFESCQCYTISEDNAKAVQPLLLMFAYV